MLGRSATSLSNLAAVKFAERHEFVSMSFNLALYNSLQVVDITTIQASCFPENPEFIRPSSKVL